MLSHGPHHRTPSPKTRAAPRSATLVAPPTLLEAFLKPTHRSSSENIGRRLPPPPPPEDTRDPGDDIPLIGGDHDFVVPQAWPDSVLLIQNNVFCASRPFPVTKRSGSSDDKCYCYKCCLADGGTTMTSSCINVATYCVCDDLNCLLGPSCGNRFEQTFELHLIETRAGLGVVCYEDIPRGSFVVEYVGEILYADDAARRPNKQYQVELRTKASWGGSSDLVIDAQACGNKSRFINHSCRPNCAMFDCKWANLARLGIFAQRKIPALQELTFSYRKNGLTLFTCACGFPECVSNQ